MSEKIVPIDRSQLPRVDTYPKWQEAQKIPIITGFFVEDVTTVELAPWDLKGGLADFVNLDGTGDINNSSKSLTR